MPLWVVEVEKDPDEDCCGQRGAGYECTSIFKFFFPSCEDIINVP